MRPGALMTVLVWLTACATSISIKEELANSPLVEGVPVNSLVPYKVESLRLGGAVARAGSEAPAAQPGTLDLVDPNQVLAIDVCRDPLASGTLKLQLTERQTVKVLEVESTPGAVDAAKAAADIASATSDIRKAGNGSQ